MRQRNFKKPFEFCSFCEIFDCGMTRLRNTNLSVFMQCHYTRTILRNNNMGQSLLKKHSKYQNFNEILYCGMIRPRSTYLDVFIQCQYARTILRKKKMGQSLFKKYSKFQNFDKILYCGMARFRNVKLAVFRQYQNTKTILKTKSMEQSYFKKLSKFQKFQLRNFTLIWPKEEKMNSVRLDMTLLKRIRGKKKLLDKLTLKKNLNYTDLVKYCVMAKSRNSNRFLMGIGKSLSQKGIIKVYENVPIQP